MNKSNILILVLFFSISNLLAQEVMLEDIGTALRSSSAKELIKYAGNTLRIQINGENTTYSKPQAEAILKDFFQKNIAEDFQYTHKGSSENGFIYRIGKYTAEKGSFRLYMLLKKDNQNYYIDTISFSKE